MKKIKCKLILSLIAMIVALSLVVGVSFAWFNIGFTPSVDAFSLTVQGKNVVASLAITRDKGTTSVDDDETVTLGEGDTLIEANFFDVVQMGETFTYVVRMRYLGEENKTLSIQTIFKDIGAGVHALASDKHYDAGSFYKLRVISGLGTTASEVGTLEGTLGAVGEKTPLFDCLVFNPSLTWDATPNSGVEEVKFSIQFGDWKGIASNIASIDALSIGSLILRCE